MIPSFNPPVVELQPTTDFKTWFKRMTDQFPQYMQYLKDHLDKNVKTALDYGPSPALNNTATSPYNASPAGEEFIYVAAPFTVNLPPAKGIGIGKRVMNSSGGGNVSVVPNGSDTINGANATDNIGTQYQCHLYRDAIQGSWVKEY